MAILRTRLKMNLSALWDQSPVFFFLVTLYQFTQWELFSYLSVRIEILETLQAKVNSAFSLYFFSSRCHMLDQAVKPLKMLTFTSVVSQRVTNKRILINSSVLTATSSLPDFSMTRTQTHVSSSNHLMLFSLLFVVSYFVWFYNYQLINHKGNWLGKF